MTAMDARPTDAGLDSTTADRFLLDLVELALISACDEMAASLKRSSVSPIIREMDDFSCALFTADGRLVAQADGIPSLLGAMSSVVSSVRARWGDQVREGDCYLLNDPYHGGMHLPDLNLVMPVHHAGEVVAWVAASAHHIDVGGVNPGSEGASLTDTFAEGLVLRGVRLYRDGALNPDVEDVLRANVRDPISVLADLKAQHAACLTGAARIVALMERHGVRTLSQLMDEVIDRGSAHVRRVLESLPDGTGSAEGWIDDDGVGGPPVRLHVTLTKRGDRLVVDLSGCDPQVSGAYNIPWASTQAVALFTLRLLMGSSARINDGLLHHLDIVCPEGLVPRPCAPAAVSLRHNTCQRLADVMVRALGDWLPDRAVASSSVSFACISIATSSAADGRATVFADVVGGGAGANRLSDGYDGVDTYMSNVGLMPAEVAEHEYPVRILSTRVIEGSGGAGRTRGGHGLERTYQVLAGPSVLTYYLDQSAAAFSAAGIEGGEPGSPAHARVDRADGGLVCDEPKATLVVEPGTTVTFRTSGGGGWGAVVDHTDRP
jgi:N-methylhydantoinase B